ncbi:hypothetical protein ST47_g3592 [Ascochyta rabiei]|uniref:Uncharacterized protein n=2 Tax=Didymella rabiei TaxID=5454 RepID=A0A163HF38_DIDRA|nr:hypothetical protein ST47_g3592 [Ascochyta rabiei]
MTILCNGERVEVTENLYDFLCYWASNQEGSSYIWIDALCIDQHNISEQSHQVNIMGQIYSAADRVLVWLGPEDDSVYLAFDIVERLNSLEPQARSALNPHEVTTDHLNLLLDLTRWKALSHLFSRTWFSRAWIIQEAVFARSCTVICGSHTTSWDTLANISRFLATSSWTTFLRNPAVFEDNADQWYNTPARLAAQHKTWKGSHKDGLLYALIRARPSACQDPRDKVYSQLHLGQADIFPDYNLSESEVYINTAMYILERSGSMLLLTCVEGEAFQTPAFCLPSWVPDWSVQKFVGLRMTGYRHFHAAIRRSPTYSVSRDKRVLDVEAVKLDDIVETSDKKENLRANLHSPTFWHLISRLPSTYATTHGIQSREEVVWRTLTTNRGSVLADCRAQYPAPDGLKYSFRDWILWRYATSLEEPATFPIPSTEHNILPTQDELEDTCKRAANDPAYLTALAHRASLFDLHYSHAMLQRPYRTKKGHFGIGTQCLREGDSVWLVSGCRVPVIFRPIEGSMRHRLVGGSYLHGFMDREALNQEDVNFEMVSLE